MSDEQTPRRRGPEVWRTLGGALLITLGVTLLIERATGIDLSWVPLAIGIAFLAVWWRERWHGFLIAGGILTGIGLGSLLGALVDPRWANGLDTIAFGGGFFLIYALDGWKRRSWWAGLVAAIFAIIGLFELANAFRQFVDPELARGGLPVIVIALGLVLLLRTSIPRGLYRFLVVALVILAIAAASASAGGVFGGFDLFGDFQRYETTKTLAIPMDGDPLVILEAGAGDVIVTYGAGEVKATIQARARTTERARRAAESVRLFSLTSENEVVIQRMDSDPSDADISVDYELALPSRSHPQGVPHPTRARVITSSGDVTVDGSHELLEIRTASGDVGLNGHMGTVEVESASGDVEGMLMMSAFSNFRINTSSGDVQLSIEAENPTIAITTLSGSIDVEGFDGVSSRRDFNRAGAVGSLNIRTASGDIEID